MDDAIDKLMENGMSFPNAIKTVSRERAKKPKGLVGRGFVRWDEPPGYGGPVPNEQGIVIAELESGHYLVQYFDAIIGAPSTPGIFHISDLLDRGRKPTGFTFFENLEHLNFWQEHHGRHIWELNKPKS